MENNPNSTYFDMLKLLEETYSQYTEIDNRKEDINIRLEIGDMVVCKNSSFVRYDETHGLKDGITLNSIYKVISIRDLDMVIIVDDNGKEYPYFNWRFELKK